jgi:hypothetical protein
MAGRVDFLGRARVSKVLDSPRRSDLRYEAVCDQERAVFYHA